MGVVDDEEGVVVAVVAEDVVMGVVVLEDVVVGNVVVGKVVVEGVVVGGGRERDGGWGRCGEVGHVVEEDEGVVGRVEVVTVDGGNMADGERRGG